MTRTGFSHDRALASVIKRKNESVNVQTRDALLDDKLFLLYFISIGFPSDRLQVLRKKPLMEITGGDDEVFVLYHNWSHRLDRPIDGTVCVGKAGFPHSSIRQTTPQAWLLLVFSCAFFAFYYLDNSLFIYLYRMGFCQFAVCIFYSLCCLLFAVWFFYTLSR